MHDITDNASQSDKGEHASRHHETGTGKMPCTTLCHIPLSHIHQHPDNANVVDQSTFRTLRKSMQHSGICPPLIVRPQPMPRLAGGFQDEEPLNVEQAEQQWQLLDGHHRLEVLRQLGQATAPCMVCDVDDETADLLLLTLNRLRGEDDLEKRGILLDRLSRSVWIEDLARLIPETVPRIRSLMAKPSRTAPAAVRSPQAVDELPVAITFFLTPSDRKLLLNCLREHDTNRSRGLMKFVVANAAASAKPDPMITREAA